MDFAKELREDVELTEVEKTKILDDFCYARGYVDFVPDPLKGVQVETEEELNNVTIDDEAMMPFPLSKEEFFNSEIKLLLKRTIKEYRQQQAIAKIIVEDVEM